MAAGAFGYPKVTNVEIIGDLREHTLVTVTSTVTGCSEEYSKVQWFKTKYSKFEVEKLEALSSSETFKAFRIPLEAVGYFIVVKFTPVTPYGFSGEPAFAISEKVVECLPPRLESLSVTGEYSEGGILTASYGYRGGHEGKSVCDWYLHKVESDSGILIPEVSGLLQYRVSKEAMGKFVSFTCMPVRDDGIVGEAVTCMAQERICPDTTSVGRWRLKSSSWRSLSWEPLIDDSGGEGVCSKSIYLLTYMKDRSPGWFTVSIKDQVEQSSVVEDDDGGGDDIPGVEVEQSSVVAVEVEQSSVVKDDDGGDDIPAVEVEQQSYVVEDDDITAAVELFQVLGKMPAYTSPYFTPLAVPPDRILAVGCYLSPTDAAYRRNDQASKKVLCCDISSPDKRWQDFPSMHTARASPFATVADGKIYVIGSRHMIGVEHDNQYAEIFNFEDGNSWQQSPCIPPWLSPTMFAKSPAAPLFLDGEKNKHLFLHCGISGMTAYTFDLRCHSLNFAERPFRALHNQTAVVDGVLYGYDIDAEDIRAYDLVNKVWFPGPVVGLGCETVKHGEFHLFHIGGKRLCLVHVEHVEDDVLHISCKVFTVKKDKEPGGEEGETKLEANIESVGSYLVRDAFSLVDCIVI